MNDAEHSGEIQKIRDETRTAIRRNAYEIVVLVATVLLAAGSSMLVSVILTQRSERKFCAVVINVDDGYHRDPPITDAGRTQAAIYARLRSELSCPPYEGK